MFRFLNTETYTQKHSLTPIANNRKKNDDCPFFDTYPLIIEVF